MREIKFRAWDEGNKVMHFDFQFLKTGEDGNGWIVFRSDKENGRMEFDKGRKEQPPNQIILDNPHFRQQLKIMQFIGLKDKNGKEIYEGDVVIIDKKKAKVIVEWDDHMELSHVGGRAVGFRVDDNHFLEVIGNIYENSELLKEEK